jgi:purine-nucleoside phosphorylase
MRSIAGDFEENPMEMTADALLEQIDHLADLVRKRTQSSARLGMILGSGLGSLANAVDSPVTIPFSELPGWPVSTVMGHQGRLVSGTLEAHEVLVMQGRVHYYEGYSLAQVTLPVRVMQRLGIETLIVTNAAGAINPAYTPGELMLITDHINLMGMAGQTPLRGPNLDALGPRFPDMNRAYDLPLRQLALQAAAEQGIILHQGVYVCLAGPSFETPADLRFLNIIGADAVGMSTVPEVTVARHGGMRVLGISGISNKANPDGSSTTTHQEVFEAGQVLVPRLTAVLRGVLRRIG